ncbi:DUF4397 domain-containing protein [Pontibacter actiniarum]|uniref:DUF4397 domain-containing protein n=1 Tax=Pontibacter actiniarum TaxID=323450 RepID=A0A1X9YT25_9BACT|nr:DUF4397 domain-containing protein [Pontibacter actiniarum]ARS35974.1 hypothetical protein CA264_11295 [Pontibacter actiniarum]
MNNFFRKSFFSKAALVLLSVASFSLTGCMDDDLETPEPQPVTYVSFYQGSPNAPEMDIQFNNQKYNGAPIKFSNYFGYHGFVPGPYTVKLTPVNAANAYVDSSFTFKEGAAYTMFAVDELEDMELLVVQDSVKAPATGKAALRIINLSPDAPAVAVSASAAGSTNETALTNELDFKGITPFMSVDAGKYSMQIKAAGSDDVLLTVSSNDFLVGTTYTVIIRGFVTPPSGNTNALSAQVVKNF